MVNMPPDFHKTAAELNTNIPFAMPHLDYPARLFAARIDSGGRFTFSSPVRPGMMWRFG